jgi:anaerobic ribonucleoside-triphosphate reductase
MAKVNGNGLNVVKKRDGNLAPFDRAKIVRAVSYACRNNGIEDAVVWENITDKTIELVKKGRLHGAPTVDEITELVPRAARILGFDKVASSYESYANQRREIRVKGHTSRGNITDKLLMVSSFTEESTHPFTRERVVNDLALHAGLTLEDARAVAKRLETRLVHLQAPSVTTRLIREIARNEMLELGLKEGAAKYSDLTVPKSDVWDMLFNKAVENSNITANNPGALEFNAWELLSKQIALTEIFSPNLAQAHNSGAIHLHDLGLVDRVYCSGHSLEYIKKDGMRMDNLQTTSKPAGHTGTLTGHLNTFLASMQTHYSGALGIGYMNIFYAPLIESDLEKKGLDRINTMAGALERNKVLAEKFKKEGMEVSALEMAVAEEEKNIAKLRENPINALTEDEKDAFMYQAAQEVIFNGSQNAFSRGGQTLFLDFNIHAGVPEFLRNTLAVGPKGKYMMEKNGKRIKLEERKVDEVTPSGYKLSEYFEPETGRVVAREKMEMWKDPVSQKTVPSIKREEFLEAGEKMVTYGDYHDRGIVSRFAENLLAAWESGDADGSLFAFPKCDFHVDETTFTDPVQQKVLKKACKLSSTNGSTYFIMDRDAVTLAACCRLRTTLDDPYVLTHPESVRFCGFQNVTINLPQAAYRAARKGKKTLEGFFEEIDATMDLALQAHLEKKDFLSKTTGRCQIHYSVSKPTRVDGKPYIDLEKATYIIGLIGLNDAIQFITGKELHELNNEEFEKYGLGTVTHMNARTKKYSAEYGLKFSLEESPAESATRRFAKSDLEMFPESKQVIKGNIEANRPYYTNSIHLRPDAPVDLITRIKAQSLFHPAIESGAIVHAFVGDEKPSPEAIYSLVENVFKNTQSAQVTISPEFTVCKECRTTHRGIFDSCPNCGCKDPDKVTSMTRIVGYFSQLRNWNASKLEEGEDRRKGNYAVDAKQDTRTTEFHVPKLQGRQGQISGVIIGKNGCVLCDQSGMILQREAKRIKEQYGQDMLIQTYKGDTEEGMAKMLLAGANPSRVPTVVLFGHDGREIGRLDTHYSGGRATKEGAITTPKVREITDRYFATQRAE